MEVGTRVVPAERPKTLRKLRNVYENVTVDRPNDTDNGLSILSPFDEQEEWNKISEIMATFNSGLLREGVLVSEMEKEIQARFGEFYSLHTYNNNKLHNCFHNKNGYNNCHNIT